MRQDGPRSIALVLLLLFGCHGCGSSDGGPGALYLERLAGALSQELPAGLTVPQTMFAPFPRGDSLRIERAENKLKLRDTLEIHRCDLGATVGARNGALGRVQTASQRYLYDLKILAGLSACKSSSESLQQLEQQRRAELPISRFNALFAGDEWHDFVTPALIEPTQKADPGELARVLSALASVSRVDNLETLLGTLRFSRALGEQRRRWQRQSLVLEAATTMLTTARTVNPGCRNGQPTEAGRIRLNVFQRFYASGYQPLLADEGLPDRGWLLQVEGILQSVLNELPEHPQAQAVANWHEQVLGSDQEQEFGRWKTAVRRHTEAWQRQLRSCGLLPRQNTRQNMR